MQDLQRIIYDKYNSKLYSVDIYLASASSKTESKRLNNRKGTSFNKSSQYLRSKKENVINLHSKAESSPCIFNQKASWQLL